MFDILKVVAEKYQNCIALFFFFNIDILLHYFMLMVENLFHFLHIHALYHDIALFFGYLITYYSC